MSETESKDKYVLGHEGFHFYNIPLKNMVKFREYAEGKRKAPKELKGIAFVIADELAESAKACLDAEEGRDLDSDEALNVRTNDPFVNQLLGQERSLAQKMAHAFNMLRNKIANVLETLRNKIWKLG